MNDSSYFDTHSLKNLGEESQKALYSADLEHIRHQRNLDHALRMEKTQLGWFGRLFGKEENSSKNITCLIVILLLGVGVGLMIYFNVKGKCDIVKAIWDSIIPVITLSLGYLFGKR